MPIIQSKKRASQTPEQQAPARPQMATAYEMKRRNKKKMAEGGIIDTIQKWHNEPDPNKPKPESNRQLNPQKAKQAQSEVRGMAEGGEVHSTKIMTPRMVESSVIKPRMRDEEPMKPPVPQEALKPEEMTPSPEEMADDHFAEGSMDDMDDEHHDSIAAAIMARRRRMAEGGMVNQEEPSQIDELNEAALKENYDSDITDLTESMDEESDDKQDRVSAIRARMNRQRQFRG